MKRGVFAALTTAPDLSLRSGAWWSSKTLREASAADVIASQDPAEQAYNRSFFVSMGTWRSRHLSGKLRVADSAGRTCRTRIGGG
jgi:hypothetical protein